MRNFFNRSFSWIRDYAPLIAIGAGIFIVVAIIVTFIVTWMRWGYMNQTWHSDCTVQNKDILYSSTEGNTSRTYRLTTSCGTFDVEDSFAGGFNSWDRWSQLKENETYDIKTGGYRIGVLSLFPVVIDQAPAK
ncbi:hypothetical protein SEA_JUMBO_66 [Gordonia phage Jumbo]|uniref:Uncharacterized protein n=1 Tax=Gordonia phage Jumbo TaxID=1887650 RepID=A0A1B3B0P8_9CAUD|nr:secreted protein [Gordonia phage Jumbo]AOE44574.1 hypothetical protein SEA_JUMBO_66 [Gordonia phage Jumbo]